MADFISKVVRSDHRVDFVVSTANPTINRTPLPRNTDTVDIMQQIQCTSSRTEIEKGEVHIIMSDCNV
jgi:hypothetical protein